MINQGKGMEEGSLMTLPSSDHQCIFMIIIKHIIFKLKNGKLILNSEYK